MKTPLDAFVVVAVVVTDGLEVVEEATVAGSFVVVVATVVLALVVVATVVLALVVVLTVVVVEETVVLAVVCGTVVSGAFVVLETLKNIQEFSSKNFQNLNSITDVVPTTIL